MTHITITGFDAFGKNKTNPSEDLARILKLKFPDNLEAVILPTSYNCSQQVGQLLESNPKALVMFGYSKSSLGLRFERFAVNRDLAKQPDNDLDMGHEVIVPKAPLKYESTFDIEKTINLLKSQGVPSHVSTNAGGYVCNHAYFLALNKIAEQDRQIPCVFIHISSVSPSIVKGASLVVETALL